MKTRSVNILLAPILSLILRNNAFARNHILVNNTVESIVGLQNLEYSYKVTEHWTIGITGSWTSDKLTANDIKLNGHSYGGITRYYFKPANQKDSWYLAAYANKTDYEASIISSGIKYTGKGRDSIAVGSGHHWFWNNFNMNLGALISTQPNIELKDAAGSRYKDEFNPNLALEIKMGGSF